MMIFHRKRSDTKYSQQYKKQKNNTEDIFFISQYLDNQLGEKETQQLEERLQHDAALKHYYEKQCYIRRTLHSADKHIMSVIQSKGTRPYRPYFLSYWRYRRGFSIPLLLCAAGCVAILLAAQFFFMRAALSDIENGQVILNVTVDATDTSDVLQWIHAQQSLQKITIELPEHTFIDMQGQPVFMTHKQLHSFDTKPEIQ